MKKFLFGDIIYKNISKDGRSKIEFSLKGGLVPNLLFLSILIGLIIWICQSVF